MSNLDNYLTEHFLAVDQFAMACKISVGELDGLIRKRLVPAPSYTVSESFTVNSFVFGEMEAKGSTPGRYFHPANVVWVRVARETIVMFGDQAAHEKLRARFSENFQAALTELNTTTMRLRDCFTDEGVLIAAGIDARTSLVWEHFLEGTFGLCVANPNSEAAIARKEVLQEKLSQLSDNGARLEYAPNEVQAVLDLVDAFAGASMPFSPIEYHLSSRKSLVDGIRAQLESA